MRAARSRLATKREENAAKPGVKDEVGEAKEAKLESPPRKKIATDLEKRLKNIKGDTALMRALLEHLDLYNLDSNLSAEHPVTPVLLALERPDTCSELQEWYSRFATFRKLRPDACILENTVATWRLWSWQTCTHTHTR